MKTIYKYPLPISDEVTVYLPKDSKPLFVDTQRGHAFIWVEIDKDNEIEPRKFYVRGTGNPFTGDESNYIGTFFQSAFVWHVYE